MLKTRIIPCLDVKDGRVVKGVNFIDLRDAGDPVEIAAAYDEAGADELCFLDIGASHEKRGIILDVVQRTAERCFMPLTVGGGVRTLDDVRALLRAGADKVSINTAAVADRGFVARAAEKFGNQCIVVAIDAKQVSAFERTVMAGLDPAIQNNINKVDQRTLDGRLKGVHDEDNSVIQKELRIARWEIFTHGGRNPTGLDAIEYAREVVTLGAGEILLTSMDSDGTRAGFDLALTRAVSDAVPVPVIASGGVGTLDHLVEGVRDGGASAVLAASIFHFGDHTIGEAKRHMAAAGIAVRLD